MRPIGTNLDLVARRADGSTFPVDIMLNPLTHLAEPMVLAVVRDITERRAAEEQKQKLLIHDRLQFALDAAQLGWWHYDPLNRVISVDARTKEILDVTADEIAIDEIIRLIYSDDAERVWAALGTSLDPVDPRRSAAEFRVWRGGSEVRWVEVHGRALSGRERGGTSIVGTVQDVTERKECEEREHLLMRELSHRTKNMLSIVDAIARQTATTAADDFVERFSERVKALAANQDLLVRNEWQGIEIDDLVRAQLEPFANLTGHIGIHGPKLCLNAAAAQAIGLALHELATNAVKYGALSMDTGRADIGWGTDGEAFRMSWTEREGPPVSAPQWRGFGTTVMKAMMERNLDGAVDLDYAPSGMTWRLTCPAANALNVGRGGGEGLKTVPTEGAGALSP
jgi:PAS domain S-box-containing protein